MDFSKYNKEGCMWKEGKVKYIMLIKGKKKRLPELVSHLALKPPVLALNFMSFAPSLGLMSAT